jgi:hypothetical protein
VEFIYEKNFLALCLLTLEPLLLCNSFWFRILSYEFLCFFDLGDLVNLRLAVGTALVFASISKLQLCPV